MIEHPIQKEFRNPFLGEIEAEITGMEYHKATVYPGEQVNLERESKGDEIWVKNGRLEPVGCLTQKIAAWLTPLIDSGQIYLEAYVPHAFHEEASRCPLVLMVFQSKRHHRLLENTEPKNEIESLHQTVLHTYQQVRLCHDPKVIHRLVTELRPLENQELLPETRLLLALLSRLSHEGIQATVHFPVT